jgi:anthranilate synthase
MAVEHASLPVAAVQFHPESLMTPVVAGSRLIDNTLAMLAMQPQTLTA